MACPCPFFSPRASCSWSCVCRATHGLPQQRHWCTVGVLAGTYQCALRCPGRLASGTKRQPFCGCWCCCVVVVVVVVFLFTSRSRVSWNTYTPARWSSLAQACHRLCFLVALSEVFVNVSFSRFVSLFVTVHALCRMTNHVLELHRLNEIRVPLQGSFSAQFASLYFLVLPRNTHRVSFVLTSNACSVLGLEIRLVLLEFATVSGCKHQLVLVD